jgi:hypothetical protein
MAKEIIKFEAVAFARKIVSIDEYKLPDCYRNNGKTAAITRIIEMTPEEWDELAHNLTSDREWLEQGKEGGDITWEGKSYYDTIEVTDGTRRLFINAEGYTYPRYVAFGTLPENPVEEQQEQPEKEPDPEFLKGRIEEKERIVFIKDGEYKYNHERDGDNKDKGMICCITNKEYKENGKEYTIEVDATIIGSLDTIEATIGTMALQYFISALETNIPNTMVMPLAISSLVKRIEKAADRAANMK